MKREPLEYKFYKFSVLTFLMMLSAINFNVFMNPAKIVAGGVNGISIIVENLIKITPTITIFVVSVGILLVGLICSEYELVLSAVYTSIIYPVFVGITSSLSGIVVFSEKDMIIVCIFSGIITGIVSGITCKLNTSQGGIILIAQIINKKLKLSVTKLNTIFGTIIITFGGLVFGLESILYAMVLIVTSKMVMDKVLIGVSNSKMFQIITSKEEAVEDYIKNTINSKLTSFETEKKDKVNGKNVIMVLISTLDYFKLKEGIKEIDDNAFVLITDAYESKISK